MAAQPGGKGHPMFIGILIGLLLGIIIALGVALWLNRFANPFVEKGRTPEAKPVKQEAKPTGEAAKQAEAKAGERPRFEFYQILPGEKEAKPSSTPPATRDGPSAAAEKAVADARAAAKAPAAEPKPADGVKPAPNERLFLQAGAFPNESDADNLKAKIAFMGLEANVVPVDLPEKGKWYRVRLGPYKSADEANRVKSQLALNGVSSSVVK